MIDFREQNAFGGKRLINSHRFYASPEQQKSSFPCCFYFYQLTFIFMERALCQQDSGDAQTAFSDRPLREQRNQDV